MRACGCGPQKHKSLDLMQKLACFHRLFAGHVTSLQNIILVSCHRFIARDQHQAVTGQPSVRVWQFRSQRGSNSGLGRCLHNPGRSSQGGCCTSLIK